MLGNLRVRTLVGCELLHRGGTKRQCALKDEELTHQ